MPLVATLISHPARPAVSRDLANRAAERLGASANVAWLEEEIACDIALPEGGNAGEALTALRAAVAQAPVDVAVVDGRQRRKRVLLADMDSTMIEQECIDELAAEIGIKDRVAEITARAMNGEIAFEPALRERVALLAGLESAVVEKVIEGRITLASGGRTLVETMNAAGCTTALVSGGFDIFTSRVAGLLGFGEHRANRLVEEDGKLVGIVADPVLGKEAKAEALREIAQREGVTPFDVIAVGDGANDLDMIRLAGMGVALHAKPAVAAEAGIRIDHGDLTALLYLQGYRGAEFAR